jgi:hypothetical protein
MLKRFAQLMIVAALLLTAGLSLAQEGGTTTTTESDSNVTILVVICETSAVVNFTGTMEAGLDVYYQVFSGGNGTGTAITALRQVQVSGSYAFSEVANYNAGSTVAAGTTASVRVVIARENNASSTTFETTVNDVQDGCSTPQYQTGTSADAGSGTTTSTTTSTILSPFGGFLNPGYVPEEDPVVVIGPRNVLPPRQQTPGLIFAECDDYPVANPGLLYDTDNIVVFWSWYARTPELVQQHIDNAVYEVGVFDSEPFIQPVIVSDIVQRGRNYWVFYTITVGNVKPGSYPIEFKLSWKNPISDGYDDFGPGTENERFNSTCAFTVRPNPNGQTVSYEFP